MDVFCPLAAYLGSYGFCLELALRPGVQHSSLEAGFNFERVIPMAPIVARLDCGFYSAALMRVIESYNRAGQPQVDWVIKWNPRTAHVTALAERLDADTATR